MRYETVHISIDDSKLATANSWAIIHPVWWTANIYDGPEEYERSLGQFSRSQRWIFAVKWYFEEVNNGGHRQFYSNSTGIVWKDALGGLEALDAPDFTDILLQSAVRLGGSPALDRKIRAEQMKALAPNFDDLEKLFYQAEKRIDMEERIINFVRGRPSDFYFNGFIKRAVLPNLPIRRP